MFFTSIEDFNKINTGISGSSLFSIFEKGYKEIRKDATTCV